MSTFLREKEFSVEGGVHKVRAANQSVAVSNQMARWWKWRHTHSRHRLTYDWI
jgi:hypothetical protein